MFDAMKEIAARARPGARVGTEIPSLADYYAKRAGRTDLLVQQSSLRHRNLRSSRLEIFLSTLAGGRITVTRRCSSVCDKRANRRLLSLSETSRQRMFTFWTQLR